MTDLERHLPLRPTAFAVLAALARGPRTGVQILEGVDAGGASILGPGTLYRLLKELRSSGWIERVPPPPGDVDGDERRQFHGLTGDGRALLGLEAGRLRRTLAGMDAAEDPEPIG